MKFKVKNGLLNKKVISQFLKIIAVLDLILSLVLIFVDIQFEYKAISGIIFVIGLCIIYCIIWIKSNTINDLLISINNSTVHIKYGDIFDEKGKKVITFNEYFDTCVDNDIINLESINGQFIQKYITNISKFDYEISEELKKRGKIPVIDEMREKGKKEKYSLGTMIKYNKDFLLMAFTRFNNDNSANITIQEYISCLIEMWHEIDKLYSQDIVVVPLLGSGTTRFKDCYIISEQEMIELILWTFKISRVRLSYPSKLVIILRESLKDIINLYKIKEEYKNGI